MPTRINLSSGSPASRIPSWGAIKVEPATPLFNLSHARNCGALYSDGDILVMSDADALIPARFLVGIFSLMSSQGAVLAHNTWQTEWESCGQGTWAVTREAYHKIRGHDEKIEGWGAEEMDFRWRVEVAFPLSVTGFPRRWVSTIRHSDEERVRFYAEKNRRKSNERNFIQTANPRRAVNLSGWGQGIVRSYLPWLAEGGQA